MNRDDLVCFSIGIVSMVLLICMEHWGAVGMPDPPDFARVEAALRARCDPGAPVTVVRVCPDAGEGWHFGCTRWTGSGFLIHVYDGPDDRPLHGWAEVDTLEHEWAHAMAWDSPGGHGPAWGRAYARAYQVGLGAQD